MSSVLTFTAHDFFRVSRTDPGGSGYQRLEDALVRLQSTTIRTNLETGGEGTSDGFSWLNKFKINYRRDAKSGDRILKSVTIELCDWLFRALERHNTILTYDPAYFDLSPLEKRLYEIARAHCGNQAGFKIGLEKLQKRVGSECDLKKFKLILTRIAAKRQPLPEYGLRVIDPRFARSLDPRQSKPPGRTPLKSYMVFFFRLDRMTSALFDTAAEITDHEL